ncbi:hypothetical protein ACOME3_002821 [Neoechinorhynchus agilis]
MVVQKEQDSATEKKAKQGNSPVVQAKAPSPDIIWLSSPKKSSQKFTPPNLGEKPSYLTAVGQSPIPVESKTTEEKRQEMESAGSLSPRSTIPFPSLPTLNLSMNICQQRPTDVDPSTIYDSTRRNRRSAPPTRARRTSGSR